MPTEKFNNIVPNLLLGSIQTDHFPNPPKFLEEVLGFKIFSLLQNGTLENEVCSNYVLLMLIHPLR